MARFIVLTFALYFFSITDSTPATYAFSSGCVSNSALGYWLNTYRDAYGPYCSTDQGGCSGANSRIYCNPTDPCGAAEQWDDVTSQCVEAPPECVMGNYDPDTGACHIGDGGSCDDIAGYIDGHAVCNDNKNECEASGGQYGQVNGEEVCYPTPPDNAPECSGSEVLVDTGLNQSCQSPTDNPNGTDNEGNGSGGGADPDTDVGLGTPDSNPNAPPASNSDLTDPVQLQQEQIKENQATTRELKKHTAQLGDINDELNKQTDLLTDIRDGLTAEGDGVAAPSVENTDSWWTSSYEGGFSGIWDSHAADVQNTALVEWLYSWSFANSGSCPTFNMTIDLGFVSFGSRNLFDGYCYILDVIRAIMIITALLTARALIFGG